MDATYRSDLRDLNELNFARFDAKLEQRTVELDAKIDRLFRALEAKIETVKSELEAHLERRLNEFQSALTWRLVAMWATTLLAIGGLYFTSFTR